MAYQFACEDPNCEFEIRSSSEREVEQLVRAHVRDVHGGRIATVDLERGIERIDPA